MAKELMVDGGKTKAADSAPSTLNSKANDKVVAAIGRSAPVLGRSNTRTAERLRFVESCSKGVHFCARGRAHSDFVNSLGHASAIEINLVIIGTHNRS